VLIPTFDVLAAITPNTYNAEVVSGLVELEVAVPRLSPAVR